MASSSSTDETPEPGRVNDARTKACCHCCEEVFDFDPSWTKDTTCPNCEESMFSYCCPTCSYSEYGATEPSFPDHPCDSCGETREEQEREEAKQERHQEEEERIARAAAYRERVQQGIHQNAVMHTWKSLEKSPPFTHDMFRPESEADALRMAQSTWNKLRPYVVQELEAYDKEGLTKEWCQRVLSFFERSWLEDNRKGLQCGVLGDVTGTRYFTLGHMQTTIQLRQIREGHCECSGAFPTCPAVHITEKKDGSLTVTWEPEMPEGEDPREIYHTDGDKTLSLGEFVLWSARVGGFGPMGFNAKYCLPASMEDDHTVEPIGYLPTEWVGRPKLWQQERDSGFRRFQFWMRDGVVDWSGRSLSMGELTARSEANMKHCCVCYGPPPEGQELILCECGSRLYCSEDHKKKHMEIHKFEVGHSHPAEPHVCLNCGESGTKLKRCTRCKNCFFCDETCQKAAWKCSWDPNKSHKKHCQPPP